MKIHQSAPLADLPGIGHAFFTRDGGISQGLYAGLNCGPGSNDDPGAVMENRRLVAQHLGIAPQRLLSLYQIHGREVVVVTQEWDARSRPQADAMVTKERGFALGILTADCGPILFADPEAKVIGAAHAGWKGALNGVLDATVAAMEALGAQPARITAAVGPTIAQKSYEVSPDFPAPFLAQDASYDRFFRPNPARQGRLLFDLAGYITMRLGALGLAYVDDLRHDTLTDPNLFSYRRATIAGEADYGRQLSAIVLK